MRVLTLADIDLSHVAALLGSYGLRLVHVDDGAPIPGSYWGPPEAGLLRSTVYVRADTPVHSLLHEAGHAICMDAARRAVLDTDAGGEFAEEDAVCYLQVVLAGELPGVGRERVMDDMDRWGYTFRLGSAHRWHAEDAADARAWLARHGLLDAEGRPTWRTR